MYKHRQKKQQNTLFLQHVDSFFFLFSLYFKIHLYFFKYTILRIQNIMERFDKYLSILNTVLYQKTVSFKIP